MKTKKQARAICEALAEVYPGAECSLTYDEAWQLMVSVRLSAQCTDARVNVVTKVLFEKYPTLEALAAAGPQAIEDIVRPCGLGKSKARDIAAATGMLLERYKGNMPDTMEELLTLPGVGRKSANLILGDIFGKPAIVADTHCIRISGRLGLTKSKDPVQVERDLRAVVPPELGNDLCHRFVLHGRAVCTARKAMCAQCVLTAYCDEYKRTQKKEK